MIICNTLLKYGGASRKPITNRKVAVEIGKERHWGEFEAVRMQEG